MHIIGEWLDSQMLEKYDMQIIQKKTIISQQL